MPISDASEVSESIAGLILEEQIVKVTLYVYRT